VPYRDIRMLNTIEESRFHHRVMHHVIKNELIADMYTIWKMVITYIVTGQTRSPANSCTLWHDRAVFHFLTEPEDIQRYLDLVSHFVTGDLILATFSNEGPKRCSGLEVKQYDIKSLCSLLDSTFDLVESFTEDHITPFDTKQNFLFARFKRRQSVR
jgi:hypothetical protein